MKMLPIMLSMKVFPASIKSEEDHALQRELPLNVAMCTLNLNGVMRQCACSTR
jgi:hypothetical protein